MSITTKAGDKGLTALFTGDRVVKFSPIVEANGTLDELDSFIGEAKHHVPGEMVEVLERIQVQLYDLMAELASRGKYTKVGEEETKWLEGLIHRYEADVQLRPSSCPVRPLEVQSLTCAGRWQEGPRGGLQDLSSTTALETTPWSTLTG